MIQGSDGALYGTASRGGSSGGGTVFKLNADGSGFTVLWNFDGFTTGSYLTSGLIQGRDGALYGTTVLGGSSGYGTVFKLNTDGTGFTVLKGDFDGSTTGGSLYSGVIQGRNGVLYGTASQGGNGYGTLFKLNTDGSGFTVLKSDFESSLGLGLIEGTDGALYGTTVQGGSSGFGTVFKLNTDGSGFTVLKGDFDYYTTGVSPHSRLMQGTDGALYGTTYGGGTGGYGTVFKLNADGSGFSVLKGDFDDATTGGHLEFGLIQGTDGALYGTAFAGGSGGYGTVFRLNTDGTGFTVLKGDFDCPTSGCGLGSELIQGTDGAVYGTASRGGSGVGGGGTVFKLNVDGTGYSVLNDFPYGPDTSETGGYPYSGVIQGTDGALYGTTEDGGSDGYGTVFKLNNDGTGFSVLENFDYFTTGGYPESRLLQGTDGALYGTTQAGGSNGYGTVFKLKTDGTGFTVLKGDFDYTATGGYLNSGLIQGTDGALYGTAAQGGSKGYGTTFKLNTDGSGFTVLKGDFDIHSTSGGYLQGGLVQSSDGTLYGTAHSGGSGGYGTVFKLNTDGSGFTVLKGDFDFYTTGGILNAGLMQGADGALYGTAVAGGSGGYGTVFKLNTDGTGFTVLENLDRSTTGGKPQGGLVQRADGTLYGAAYQGGSNDFGTVFQLNPDGTDFSVVLNFDNVSNGGYPAAELTEGEDGTLYGTTSQGGGADAGTVFRLGFGPCAGADDGTACDDGDACTQTDTCQAGVCVGSNPVICAASNPCHLVGTCDPSTGACSNPSKADGAACDDGNACTQTDVCQAGTCTGSNYSWSGVLPPVSADGSSVFKLGRTIPTKFKLTGACSGNPNLSAAIYFYQVTDAGDPDNEASSTSAADTGTVFRYSASDDQYIYDLGTKGLTPGTWNLGIDLHDGTGLRTVTVRLTN